MFKSRKELLEAVKNMYIPLLERAAERYVTNHTYLVTDGVGFNVTLMEELFRPLWGIAPVLNECDLKIKVEGKLIPATDFITRVLIEGTDPTSDKRFDKEVTEFTKYQFANQSVTEIAGYLVAVCFAKEKLWDTIPSDKRDQISDWIKKWSICAIQNSWQNNHYWYPIFCIEILKKLGFDMSEVDEDMKKGYDFLETLYYGAGWYSDGELGRFDYYESWAHHAYTLLWILIADKNTPGYEEKCEKYRKRSTEFLNFFSHYFDSDGGLAMYGRSNSYRFAAVCPYGLAALAGCDIDLGVAKSLILKNISYYFENCTMVDGCFPCGYLYQTTGFVESYTCDGSITCYTEGLMCLLAGEDHPLWQAECREIPIECGNYLEKSKLDGLEIILQGEDKKGGVTLYNNALHYFQDTARTFNDMAGLYSKFVYNSRSGFSLSTADMWSADNMISLTTESRSMRSVRKKIYDMEYVDGVMSSTHMPFENDKETTIKTWLIPLWSGFHVRIHKVKTSQAYRVRETGFSIGNDSDAYTNDAVTHTSRFGNTLSYVNTVSSVDNITYNFEKVHPGMHLLKPQGIIPYFETEMLEAGEYIFASAFCFTTDGVIENEPKITLTGNTVTVTQGDITKVIEVK